MFAPHRADAVIEDERTSDLTAIVSTQLEQLRQLAIDFSERQLEAEGRLEKAFRNREKTLEGRIAEEDARLAGRRSDFESEITREREAIQAWREEINDREPQHERRRLRERLTGEVSDYLNQPWEGSLVSRHIVQFLYIGIGFLFLAISFGLVVYQSDQGGDSLSAFWAQYVKSFVSGLGGAAFVWAGLSGLSKSVKAENDYVSSLRKYSFDMDRASWIVETMLQMNERESAQIPDRWLDAVCRDLFSDGEANNHREPQPLEALAALLDTTARAKIGTSGFEFEIDKKGAQKLSQQV